MRSLAAAIGAALLLVLAYPPRGWAVLTVPAVALFLWAVTETRRWSTALGVGFVFGTVFFGLLFPWIGELGIIALVPLVISQAAFPAVYAAGLRRHGERHRPGWWLVAVGGWAAMEYVRVRFPVGGFGWGLLGYPAGEYAASRVPARWIGVSGWSVVLAGVAAAAVLVWRARDRRGGWVLLAGSVAAVIGLVVAGAFVDPRTVGPELKVAIVQGNTPCPGTHCENERYRTYQNHLALTRTLAPGSVDLVVWPEGSTGGTSADPVLNRAVGDAIATEARRLGAVFLVGGDRVVSETEWVNANVVFDKSGRIIGEYRKRHPVPFGEYVPARPLFGWVRELAAVPRDMIRGTHPLVVDAGFGPFGSVISFESSFARYGRETIRDGARLLVVATSQVSYPRSNASDQLIGITRMRAAELGVDVVHGAVTGRSTLITDGGVVGRRTGLATADIVTGTVHLSDGSPTLYVRWGDWLQIVAMLAGLAAWARRWAAQPEAETGR